MTAAIAAVWQGHDIVALEWAGEPVVSAGQLAEALGYRDASDLTQHWGDEAEEGVEYHRLTGDDLRTLKDYPSLRGVVGTRARHLILLTEAGVNLALIRSQAPAGRALRRWICRELLPQLRRGQAPGGLTSAAVAALPPALRSAPAEQVAELLEAEAAAGRPLPALRRMLRVGPARITDGEIVAQLRAWLAERGWPETTVQAVCTDLLKLPSERHKQVEREVAGALRQVGYRRTRASSYRETRRRPTVWRAPLGVA